MSDNGDRPDLGFEAAMSPGEIVQFCDEQLWPAVNYLWGADFRNSSVPGESLEVSRTTVDYRGQKTYTSLDVRCDTDETYDTDELSRDIHIRLDRSRPDLTEAMIKIADFDEAEIDSELEEQALLLAWEIYNFHFAYIGRSLFRVVAEQAFELQDPDGATMWESEGEVSETSTDSFFGATPSSDFHSTLCSTLNATNRIMIEGAFLAIGVPDQIVDQ